MSKLWVVGCSIAHGVGVEPEQRWGELLANQLGLESVFLTAEGSSIEWAADQILRADINSDDYVAWGLTSPNRSLYYNDTGHAQHVLNVYYKNNPEFVIDQRHLVDLNLAYKAVNYVRQVQNYLDKINCQYCIGYMLPGLSKHTDILLTNLSDTPKFIKMFDPSRITVNPELGFFTRSGPANIIFDDLGADGMHPGPKQHESYARQFLNVLGNFK